MKIQENSVVSIDYTLTSDEGEVLDSSQGGEPLTYIHGMGNLIPGLERELEGKGMGLALKVRISPEDAYGIRDEAMVARVPRTQMPKGAPLEVGMQFQAAGPEGVQVVTLVKVEDDAVWLDANHPLAGMHLTFDVTIVAVRTATAEELEHGHVHGPGGHQH